MDSTDKRRKTTSTFTVRKKVHFCTKLQLGKHDILIIMTNISIAAKNKKMKENNNSNKKEERRTKDEERATMNDEKCTKQKS